MSFEKWTKAIETKDLKEGVPAHVTVEGQEVLLLSTAGDIYAVSHACTHYGGPLSDGTVDGCIVTCPYHHAQFDVSTGELKTTPALDDLTKYDVKIEKGTVYIRDSGRSQFPELQGVDERRFVIIGGGAAGSAAAEMLRREGFAGHIVMISADTHLPYDRPNLSKAYMAGEAEPDWIPLRDEEFYENRNIEPMLNQTVESIDPKTHSVNLASGMTIEYNKLLIATGGVPRKLNGTGVSSQHVYYLRTFDDAQRISDLASKSKRVLILGASFIGMEVAASLAHRNVEVELAAPEKVPMSIVFGERIGKLFQSTHEKNGVIFHMGTTAERIEGENPVRVHLSDGTDLEVDFVVAGLGVVPATSFLDSVGLVEHKAVPVNGKLQTADPDIYAAGDVALYPELRTGEPQRIEHWTAAQSQGRHAARNMLGADEQYTDVPFFWTRQFGASYKYIGHASEWDDIVYDGEVENGEFVAGFFKDGTLRAVFAKGRMAKLVSLTDAMRAGEAIGPDDFSRK